MADLRGRTIPAYSLDPDEITIVTDPGQALYDPRIAYDLDEEMVGSIMAFGVITAITVTRDGDRIVVVDGRRRVLHAREANKRLIDLGKPPVSVPFTIRHGETHKLFEAAIAANTHRRADIAYISAIKSAQALNNGSTLPGVARAFSVTVTTIENWLSLLRLHPKILHVVKVGKIPYTVAMRLAKLPQDQQIPKFKALVKAGATNANAVRAVIGGKLEKVRPPSRQQLRRIADAIDVRAAVAKGASGQIGDAYAVLAMVLGRISVDEALDILPAGPITEAIQKGMGLKV